MQGLLLVLSSGITPKSIIHADQPDLRYHIGTNDKHLRDQPSHSQVTQTLANHSVFEALRKVELTPRPSLALNSSEHEACSESVMQCGSRKYSVNVNSKREKKKEKSFGFWF